MLAPARAPVLTIPRMPQTFWLDLAGAVVRGPGEVLREHPALSILSLPGVAIEALRGLIRPPLSWDSLMYHLLLAATWLRDRNLLPVFGSIPVNYYGYVPANGSIWF